MSQPVEVYPNSPLPSQPNSSHSHGSFGPVFVVLAVIFAVSVVACVVGRLCDRRYDRDAEKEAAVGHHHSKAKNRASHGVGTRELESRQEPGFNMRSDGDTELGFGKKNISSVKMPTNGRSEKQAHEGGHKPAAVEFADNV